MKNLKLALLNIHMNMKNARELKSSFIISIIGMAINNTAFIILWYYFGKEIGVINGWEPTDIFGLYGVTTLSYGIIMAFFGGIVDLPKYISSGVFDKYLTSPKNILMKISTSKVSTSALGDFLFGLICFIIFVFTANISLVQILLGIYLIIIATIIFYSFVLICMSISFYLMDGENVSTGLYGMFLGNSMYHGGAFTGILRIIFIFVVPSLLLGALPVEIIKNPSISGIVMITCACIFWFILSILFFYKSAKKYESNSLFGFGN